MKRSHAWIAGAVTADLAVFGLGWVLVVSPARAETTQLQATASQQQDANVRTRTSLATLRRQAAELPATQSRVERIARQIPQGVELPEVIDALSEAGRATGVDVTSVAPAPPSVLSTSDGRVLQEVPITTSVSGSYPAMQKYLTRLENLPRAAIVSSLSVHADTTSPNGTRVTAGIALKVFTAAAASAAPGGATATTAAGGAATGTGSTGTGGTAIGTGGTAATATSPTTPATD
jgi:type IV pilus assembly protein PilO